MRSTWAIATAAAADEAAATDFVTRPLDANRQAIEMRAVQRARSRTRILRTQTQSKRDRKTAAHSRVHELNERAVQ